VREIWRNFEACAPNFWKLTATATREAAARFMATWYRRTYGRLRIERLQRQLANSRPA